jgi:putative alpha-1,2-mannosidase
MASLVTLAGGPTRFNARLNYMHDNNLVYIGDEQAFLTVYQHHYGARPGLSAKRAHYYIPSQFNSSTIGIPGNDDSGAMGSFIAWSMMGLWPVAGQDVYLISSPFFKEVNVTSKQTGKTATIRAKNFIPPDGQGNYANIYVQSVTLDGQSWTKSWIGHSLFLDGGILEITLGKNESLWGTSPGDLPPSMSTGGMVM